MNYMLLIKLLYLLDRRALSLWGRPVTGDDYFSMKYGPVLSEVLGPPSALTTCKCLPSGEMTMATNTQIPTLDHTGAIPAYVAKPTGTPQGAIIVIQEIFGVNPGIAKKAEDWAALGYLAVAPDVFWRQQPGVELNPDVAEEFQQGVALMMKHDFFAGIQDIEAVIHWIRRDQNVAKVGLVGFCMGGKIAYMTAA